MNYIATKAKSQIQKSYYEFLDSAFDLAVAQVIKKIYSHFLIEINFDMDNANNNDIIRVLQLIDEKMGTKKLKSNSYTDYKGDIILRATAQYFVYFKKVQGFMIVKGTPYEGSDYSDRTHIYFGGKGAHKLSKMFLNQMNKKANPIVFQTKVQKNTITVVEMLFSSTHNSLYWGNERTQIVKPQESLYMNEADKEFLFDYLRKFQKAKALFDKIDVSYKVGLLFYGPPGTGKSSISKVIAHTLGAPLYVVNMALFNSEAIDKIKGLSSSKQLKIVLLEDIDYIFGKRQNDRTPEEKANGNALLQLLDGVTTLSNIVFIATTNDIDSLDDAIKRDGRFDVKIHMDNIEKPLAKQMVRGIGISSDEVIEEILSPEEEKYNPANIQNRTIQHIFKHMEDIDEFVNNIPEEETDNKPAKLLDFFANRF